MSFLRSARGENITLSEDRLTKANYNGQPSSLYRQEFCIGRNQSESRISGWCFELNGQVGVDGHASPAVLI